MDHTKEKQRKASQKWRLANKEKAAAYMREYRRKDPNKFKEAKREEYQRTQQERIEYRQQRHAQKPWTTMASTSKRRARDEGVPYNISADYIESIWPADNLCPVFGVEFTISKKGQTRDQSASLDRIVPELGYTTGNVIVVSLKANRMKNNGTVEDLGRVFNFYSKLISS
jgi:hypothetical protein